TRTYSDFGFARFPRAACPALMAAWLRSARSESRCVVPRTTVPGCHASARNARRRPSARRAERWERAGQDTRHACDQLRSTAGDTELQARAEPLTHAQPARAPASCTAETCGSHRLSHSPRRRAPQLEVADGEQWPGFVVQLETIPQGGFHPHRVHAVAGRNE